VPFYETPRIYHIIATNNYIYGYNTYKPQPGGIVIFNSTSLLDEVRKLLAEVNTFLSVIGNVIILILPYHTYTYTIYNYTVITAIKRLYSSWSLENITCKYTMQKIPI